MGQENPEKVSHTMLLLDADTYFKRGYRKLKNNNSGEYVFFRNCGLSLGKNVYVDHYEYCIRDNLDHVNKYCPQDKIMKFNDKEDKVYRNIVIAADYEANGTKLGEL